MANSETSFDRGIAQRRRRLWILVAPALAILGFVLGCEEPAQIKRYVMPRDHTGIPERVKMPMAASTTNAPSVESRMITAIAQLPTATWFFKTVGPVEKINGLHEQLTAFLHAVKFSDSGQPVWTLPASWTDSGSTPGRLTTLKIPTTENTTVEMAISELGPNQNLTDNVNRWRRDQLGLKPLDDAAAVESLKQLPYEGGTFLVFDEIGMYRGGMGGPMSPTPPPQVDSSTQSNSNSTPNEPEKVDTSVPFEFSVPAGWSRIPNAPFVAMKFEKSDGQARATIAMTELTAEPNPWETSLSSWLTELNSGELPPEVAAKMIGSRTVGGLEGKFAKLILPDASKSIYGVRVEVASAAWYFKLAGDKALVESSVPEFEAFLDSIRFK